MEFYTCKINKQSSFYDIINNFRYILLIKKISRYNNSIWLLLLLLCRYNRLVCANMRFSEKLFFFSAAENGRSYFFFSFEMKDHQIKQTNGRNIRIRYGNTILTMAKWPILNQFDKSLALSCKSYLQLFIFIYFGFSTVY